MAVTETEEIRKKYYDIPCPVKSLVAPPSVWVTVQVATAPEATASFSIEYPLGIAPSTKRAGMVLQFVTAPPFVLIAVLTATLVEEAEAKAPTTPDNALT